MSSYNYDKITLNYNNRKLSINKLSETQIDSYNFKLIVHSVLDLNYELFDKEHHNYKGVNCDDIHDIQSAFACFYRRFYSEVIYVAILYIIVNLDKRNFATGEVTNNNGNVKKYINNGISVASNHLFPLFQNITFIANNYDRIQYPYHYKKFNGTLTINTKINADKMCGRLMPENLANLKKDGIYDYNKTLAYFMFIINLGRYYDTFVNYLCLNNTHEKVTLDILALDIINCYKFISELLTEIQTASSILKNCFSNISDIIIAIRNELFHAHNKFKDFSNYKNLFLDINNNALLDIDNLKLGYIIQYTRIDSVSVEKYYYTQILEIINGAAGYFFDYDNYVHLSDDQYDAINQYESFKAVCTYFNNNDKIFSIYNNGLSIRKMNYSNIHDIIKLGNADSLLFVKKLKLYIYLYINKFISIKNDDEFSILFEEHANKYVIRNGNIILNPSREEKSDNIRYDGINFYNEDNVNAFDAYLRGLPNYSIKNKIIPIINDIILFVNNKKYSLLRVDLSSKNKENLCIADPHYLPKNTDNTTNEENRKIMKHVENLISAERLEENKKVIEGQKEEIIRRINLMAMFDIFIEDKEDLSIKNTVSAKGEVSVNFMKDDVSELTNKIFNEKSNDKRYKHIKKLNNLLDKITMESISGILSDINKRRNNQSAEIENRPEVRNSNKINQNLQNIQALNNDIDIILNAIPDQNNSDIKYKLINTVMEKLHFIDKEILLLPKPKAQGWGQSVLRSNAEKEEVKSDKIQDTTEEIEAARKEIDSLIEENTILFNKINENSSSYELLNIKNNDTEALWKNIESNDHKIYDLRYKIYEYINTLNTNKLNSLILELGNDAATISNDDTIEEQIEKLEKIRLTKLKELVLQLFDVDDKGYMDRDITYIFNENPSTIKDIFLMVKNVLQIRLNRISPNTSSNAKEVNVGYSTGTKRLREATQSSDSSSSFDVDLRKRQEDEARRKPPKKQRYE